MSTALPGRLARLGAGVVALGTAASVVLLAAVVPAGMFTTDALAQVSAPPVAPALRRPPERSVIEAADGSRLATLHAAQDRIVVPLSAVAPVARKAVIAIEDARFYQHGALDVQGLARAALADLRAGSVVEGGSTITQQLVKQTVTGGAVSVGRKVAEAIDATQLERRLPKDAILADYLNQVYFGDGVYGIEAAAEHYFDTSARRLTLAQAAALAGTIASPGRFRPTAGRAALARRNVVLGRMAAVGLATPAAVAAARHQPTRLHLHTPATDNPYFVQVVQQQLLHDPALDAALGPAGSPARYDNVFEGGLVVHTTLGPASQRLADDAVASQLTAGGGPQAALVSIDPRGGAVRAMVAGRDFAASKVNLATGAGGAGGFPPGSSFKVFFLVAALEQGWTAATALDAPAVVTVRAPACPAGYTVHNAEPNRPGRIDLARATAGSVNTYYAQLMAAVGPGRAIAVARRMGITSPLAPYCSLVLGSENVTPLELASAYATLADGGVACRPSVLSGIDGPDGRPLASIAPSCRRVLDPGIAARAVALLRGVVAPGGTGRLAAIGRPLAGKTGTTGNFEDAWFSGFTPQLATSVWVGHPDSQVPMTRAFHGGPVFGGTIPALIFRRYMAAALAGQPVLPLPG